MADGRRPGALRSGDGAAEEGYVGWRDLAEWRSRLGAWVAAAATRVAAVLGPHTALVLVLVVGGGLAIAGTAATAEIYEAVSDEDGIAALDQPALDAAVSLRTPALEEAVTAYTDIGGPVLMPIVASVVTLSIAWWWRRWTPLVLMLFATAGSLLMTRVGKDVVGRTRPPLDAAVPPYEESASFPSGHSLNAIVVAGVVAYLLVQHQKRGWSRALTVVLAAGFALTMGLSRVYLGHHWLTDVVVAWTLGLAWLAVVVTAHRIYLTVRRRGRAAPGAVAAPAS